MPPPDEAVKECSPFCSCRTLATKSPPVRKGSRDLVGLSLPSDAPQLMDTFLSSAKHVGSRKARRKILRQGRRSSNLQAAAIKHMPAMKQIVAVQGPAATQQASPRQHVSPVNSSTRFGGQNTRRAGNLPPNQRDTSITCNRSDASDVEADRPPVMRDSRTVTLVFPGDKRVQRNMRSGLRSSSDNCGTETISFRPKKVHSPAEDIINAKNSGKIKKGRKVRKQLAEPLLSSSNDTKHEGEFEPNAECSVSTSTEFRPFSREYLLQIGVAVRAHLEAFCQRGTMVELQEQLSLCCCAVFETPLVFLFVHDEELDELVAYCPAGPFTWQEALEELCLDNSTESSPNENTTKKKPTHSSFTTNHSATSDENDGADDDGDDGNDDNSDIQQARFGQRHKTAQFGNTEEAWSPCTGNTLSSGTLPIDRGGVKSLDRSSSPTNTSCLTYELFRISGTEGLLGRLFRQASPEAAWTSLPIPASETKLSTDTEVIFPLTKDYDNMSVDRSVSRVPTDGGGILGGSDWRNLSISGANLSENLCYDHKEKSLDQSIITSKMSEELSFRLLPSGTFSESTELGKVNTLRKNGDVIQTLDNSTPTNRSIATNPLEFETARSVSECAKPVASQRTSSSPDFRDNRLHGAASFITSASADSHSALTSESRRDPSRLDYLRSTARSSYSKSKDRALSHLTVQLPDVRQGSLGENGEAGSPFTFAGSCSFWDEAIRRCVLSPSSQSSQNPQFFDNQGSQLTDLRDKADTAMRTPTFRLGSLSDHSLNGLEPECSSATPVIYNDHSALSQRTTSGGTRPRPLSKVTKSGMNRWVSKSAVHTQNCNSITDSSCKKVSQTLTTPIAGRASFGRTASAPLAQKRSTADAADVVLIEYFKRKCGACKRGSVSSKQNGGNSDALRRKQFFLERKGFRTAKREEESSTNWFDRNSATAPESLKAVGKALKGRRLSSVFRALYGAFASTVVPGPQQFDSGSRPRKRNSVVSHAGSEVSAQNSPLIGESGAFHSLVDENADNHCRLSLNFFRHPPLAGSEIARAALSGRSWSRFPSQRTSSKEDTQQRFSPSQSCELGPTNSRKTSAGSFDLGLQATWRPPSKLQGIRRDGSDQLEYISLPGPEISTENTRLGGKGPTADPQDLQKLRNLRDLAQQTTTKPNAARLLCRVLFSVQSLANRVPIGLLCIVNPPTAAEVLLYEGHDGSDNDDDGGDNGQQQVPPEFEEMYAETQRRLLDEVARQTQGILRHVLQVEQMAKEQAKRNVLLRFYRDVYRDVEDSARTVQGLLDLVLDSFNTSDVALFVADYAARDFICAAGHPCACGRRLPRTDPLLGPCFSSKRPLAVSNPNTMAVPSRRGNPNTAFETGPRGGPARVSPDVRRRVSACVDGEAALQEYINRLGSINPRYDFLTHGDFITRSALCVPIMNAEGVVVAILVLLNRFLDGVKPKRAAKRSGAYVLPSIKPDMFSEQTNSITHTVSPVRPNTNGPGPKASPRFVDKEAEQDRSPIFVPGPQLHGDSAISQNLSRSAVLGTPLGPSVWDRDRSPFSNSSGGPNRSKTPPKTPRRSSNFRVRGTPSNQPLLARFQDDTVNSPNAVRKSLCRATSLSGTLSDVSITVRKSAPVPQTIYGPTEALTSTVFAVYSQLLPHQQVRRLRTGRWQGCENRAETVSPLTCWYVPEASLFGYSRRDMGNVIVFSRQDEVTMEVLAREVTAVLGGLLGRFCMKVILKLQPQPSILEAALPTEGTTAVSPARWFHLGRHSTGSEVEHHSYLVRGSAGPYGPRGRPGDYCPKTVAASKTSEPESMCQQMQRADTAFPRCLASSPSPSTPSVSPLVPGSVSLLVSDDGRESLTVPQVYEASPAISGPHSRRLSANARFPPGHSMSRASAEGKAGPGILTSIIHISENFSDRQDSMPQVTMEEIAPVSIGDGSDYFVEPWDAPFWNGIRRASIAGTEMMALSPHPPFSPGTTAAEGGLSLEKCRKRSPSTRKAIDPRSTLRLVSVGRRLDSPDHLGPITGGRPRTRTVSRGHVSVPLSPRSHTARSVEGRSSFSSQQKDSDGISGEKDCSVPLRYDFTGRHADWPEKCGPIRSPGLDWYGSSKPRTTLNGSMFSVETGEEVTVSVTFEKNAPLDNTDDDIWREGEMSRDLDYYTSRPSSRRSSSRTARDKSTSSFFASTASEGSTEWSRTGPDGLQSIVGDSSDCSKLDRTGTRTVRAFQCIGLLGRSSSDTCLRLPRRVLIDNRYGKQRFPGDENEEAEESTTPAVPLVVRRPGGRDVPNGTPSRRELKPGHAKQNRKKKRRTKFKVHDGFREVETMEGMPALHEAVENWAVEWWFYGMTDLTQFFLDSLQSLNLIDGLFLSRSRLSRFFRVIAGCYHRNNPYHNFFHAIQVYHISWVLLTRYDLAMYLLPAELLGVLIGSICHDIDHPGLNNELFLALEHPLAIVYNDMSVLENHHCAFTFKLMEGHSELDFRTDMSGIDKATFRQAFIRGVLATDMKLHSQKLASFSTRVSRHDSNTSPLRLSAPDDRNLLIEMIPHAADVSNPVTPAPLFRNWASLIIEEFNLQCDREVDMGLAVTAFMNCRTERARVECQIGFVEFIVLPLWRTFAQLRPELKSVVEQGNENARYWHAVAEELDSQERTEHADGRTDFGFRLRHFSNRHPRGIVRPSEVTLPQRLRHQRAAALMHGVDQGCWFGFG